ncbi:MAG: amino acid ABC transporter substrate-binding protein [Desulfobulbaceae bacterium]|jgi:hypothetical protein|nr:amino acid ABC transporter substrate-binding protein [Desulfobulbaceae bacterium]
MATGTSPGWRRMNLAACLSAARRQALVVLVMLFAVLLWRESTRQRPPELSLTKSGTVDMCLSCHAEEKEGKLDAAHDPAILGCAVCHLGDALVAEAKKAHIGMVKNPGDLRHAARTCSVEGCHPADIHKVKNSLMATNRGIIGTLLSYWGETKSQNTELTVEQLIDSGENSFALDYFRKLCASCHLWKQKGDMPDAPDFFNEKGGGCSACHVVPPPGAEKPAALPGDDQEVPETKGKKLHSWLTKKVASDHCVRCHNRSARIGLSYIGKYESEGGGAPFENGGLSSKQLPGERFYLDLADDVHHRRGMECIDCHTREEIMGDGHSYAHYEEQVEIGCASCHRHERDERLGKTEKGRMMTNIDAGKRLLTGKVDGKIRPLKAPKAGVCDFSAHRRLGCESCHSPWTPQCNGCHIERDMRTNHLDKLSLKETAGRWREGRSYIRYEKPMLAVWDNRVVIVTPGCQDIVTDVDKNGQRRAKLNRFTMAAINPHTIQEQGRACADCHAEPKTVGLGEGRVALKNGDLTFVGIDQGLQTGLGPTPPLDAYVDINGKALQKGSRPGLRPFTKEELRRILRVGLCVACHDNYHDAAWRNYDGKTQCPKTKIFLP